MNWDAIGAMGEVFGAAGVILTLAYLARQMRLNTIAMRNETQRDSTQMVINAYSPVIADAEVASIFLRGLDDYRGLSEVEQIRFHYVCVQRLQAAALNRSFEATFDQHVTHEMFTGLESWIERMMRHEGFRNWWDDRGKAVMSEEFSAWAETIRRRVESAA